MNGIFNNESDAGENVKLLENILRFNRPSEPTTVRLGHNKSHLGGAGDLIQSVTQAFNSPVSKFDLDTILMQIHPEVRTQKILLVGHSQGSFYVNEIYKYLIDNGVPQESIGVYHIASPAVYVAGGGQYVTSDNDKIINLVRNTEVQGNLQIRRESYGVLSGNVVASALRANISIPREPGYEEDSFGGHKFQVYMDGAGDRIAREIQGALSRLRSGESGAQGGCFTPPESDLSHKMKAAAYATADPIAGVLVGAVKSSLNSAKNLATAGTNTRGAGLTFVQNFFSRFSDSTDETSQASAAAVSISPSVAAATAQPNTRAAPPQNSIQANARLVAREDPPAREVPPVQQSAEAPAQSTPSLPQPMGIPTGMWPGGGGGTAAPPPLPPPPAPATFQVVTPSDGAVFASANVAFSGTSDSGAQVAGDATTGTTTAQADAGGNWSFVLSLPEGQSTVTISTNNATPITRTVTIDLTPPATTTISVAECALSLAASYCLVPSGTASISWNAALDAVAYGVSINGTVIATTTSISSVESLPANATSTIAIVAYDAAGNAATSTELSIRTVSSPLSINEIGWAGLEGSSNQWVEIKNASSLAIDLSHISVHRSGGTPITLSGSIPPGGIVSFNQTNSAIRGTIIAVDPFVSFSTTTGEQLSLVWNGLSLDVTPAVGTCSSWCAGALEARLGSNVSGLTGLVSPLSMERIAGAADGSLASSWRTTDSYGPSTDAGGVGIWGTPGAENSHGHPDAGIACGSFSNLLQANSPFNPSGGCFYLTKFVSGSTFGASRTGALYRGTVASSTAVAGHSLGKAIIKQEVDVMPSDAFAGEEYFYALYENRSFAPDSADFTNYFTAGVGTPPHGNYVVIPFTYQP